MWVKPGLIAMSLWSVGSSVLILYAALRGVPKELYESARLDGAGFWRQLTSVTVPLISPRSEEHTSELQSRGHIVCRLLLAKKNMMCHAVREHERWLPSPILPCRPNRGLRHRYERAQRFFHIQRCHHSTPMDLLAAASVLSF